jgi:hypothetical protein
MNRLRAWCVMLTLNGCVSQRNIGVDQNSCREPAQACGAAGTEQTYSSISAFTSLLVGRWLICSGSGMTDWASDQAGIEFTENGHFYVLHRDSSGALVRGQGLQYEGFWSTPSTDPVSNAQLDVAHADGGYNIWNPAFEDTPRKMILTGFTPNDDMAYTTVYVLDCRVDSGPDGAVGGGPMCGAPACSAAEGSVHFWQTQSELEGLLQKRWVLCTSMGIVGWASDQAGIELAPGGLFYILHPDGSGNLVRGGGVSYEGTWTLQVSGSWSQVNIVHADGGFIDAHVAIEDTPSKLFLTLDAPGAFDKPIFVADCTQ